MASTATPDNRENARMIHDMLLGMSDCDRDGFMGAMLGEIPELLGQVENLGGEMMIAGYWLAPND